MRSIKLDELNVIQLSEGVAARIVTTDNMSIMYASLKAGSRVPEHSHHHEQVVNVIEGEIALTIEGKQYRLKPGELLVVPSNMPHSAKAITDCKVIDVFYPIREDLADAGFKGYSG